jgi:ribonuclease VapC
MVIDSSAAIAILFEEPEAAWFEAEIINAELRYMSAASLIESAIVAGRRAGDGAIDQLDRLLLRLKIEFVPVTLDQAGLARVAYRKFGRGRHKAALNFGDCFSYALAKVSGESLLCKGNDFALTDLSVTSPPPSPQSR